MPFAMALVQSEYKLSHPGFELYLLIPFSCLIIMPPALPKPK